MEYIIDEVKYLAFLIKAYFAIPTLYLDTISKFMLIVIGLLDIVLVLANLLGAWRIRIFAIAR